MISFLVALAATVALLPAVIRLLTRCDAVDVPSHRSSHTVPTPRGGGVALLAGVAAGLAISGVPGLGALAVAVAGLAAVGAREDLHGLPVGMRLLGTVLGALLLLACLPGEVRLPVAALVPATLVAAVWVAAVVHATNFMDGLNGLSGGVAVVAGSTYAALGTVVADGALIAVGGALAGAGLGFLPFNAPRARVFLGDVGSYALGAVLAALALTALTAGLPLQAALGPLVPYGVDTGSTLLRRHRAGASLTQPHRDHVYQRLAGAGLSHTAVSALVAGTTAAAGSAGALALVDAPAAHLMAVVALLAVAAAYVAAPGALAASRALRRPRVLPGPATAAGTSPPSR